MSSAKQTAVVICPGRGTYNKPELGVLGRQFSDKALLRRFDDMRRAQGQDTLSELDGAARYSIAKHTRGDNASALIYAATLGDFRAINPDKIEVVAVTGNSMGWYSALACGGALSAEGGFEVVNTMGTLMQENMIGGQLIYPFMESDWHPDQARKAELLALVDDIDRTDATLTLSIDLGGMLVLAGDDAGLAAFEKAVPVVQERFPMRLANHAGFHSHLQAPVSAQGRTQLSPGLFRQPDLPLIDGRGRIWWPGACDPNALWDYTLGHQVRETYDFTHAIAQAAHEFAPDLFIVTGPGTTLGGAVAQSLILNNWSGLSDKSTFQSRQRNSPIMCSMGMDDQRKQVT
ncbi:ACP S-malonyltransferase [Ruegeria sp. HKCCA4008]|uniref:ACP S-malonyltransferase n=1 Tax=Ruegeria sp. HKCCA4008 TaxID=2682999 RepID=UPI001489A24C|nr:ACP S-malonyltransferase [Ruegeria sp. HKCCA4008]